MERYDAASAAHYAAYRPPLHEGVLQMVFEAEERFEVGLDVGCGTGRSTVALAAYCARVYGIDPSASMLERATPHPGVTYQRGEGSRIPLADASVDVATFAGSLYYADSPAAREEIRRVCRAGASVVAYDFEVLLGEVLGRIGAEEEAPAEYDHRAGFADVPGFTEEVASSERVRLEMTSAELAHVLLSDSSRLDRLARLLHTPDPFPVLEASLRSWFDGAAVEADVFYARYRVT